MSGLDHRRCYAKTQIADCRLCKPRRPCRPRFVRSRISNVTVRETLRNSFMTYHALLCGYFKPEEKKNVFSVTKFYFTSRWTLNDRWNPFRACGFSGQKWFELVVEGEELEDQASTQETEEFNVCTLYYQKVKNSGPLLSWLCLRWLVTIIDLFLWLISLSCMWQVLAYRRQEGKRDGE